MPPSEAPLPAALFNSYLYQLYSKYRRVRAYSGRTVLVRVAQLQGKYCVLELRAGKASRHQAATKVSRRRHGQVTAKSPECTRPAMHLRIY